MTEQCVALCDYFTVEEDEISFRKGDLITVSAKGSSSGFWEGFVHTSSTPKNHMKKFLSFGGESSGKNKDNKEPKKGLFPNCLVTSNHQAMNTEVFKNKAMALYDYKPSDSTEMALQKNDIIQVIGASPSVGWWYGFNETMASRINSKNQKTIDAQCGSLKSPLLFPVNFITANIVYATFSFPGRQSHELSLEAGDVISINRRWNDGWWEGIMKGRRGIFPSNYTHPNISTLTPPLFCQVCKTVYGPGSTDCKTCAKNEVIVTSMKRALDDYTITGTLADENLFAYVELDPKIGGNSALLSKADLIKSAGGGLVKGYELPNLSTPATKEENSKYECDGSNNICDKKLEIHDDEIFHRRGIATKSALEELEEDIKNKHNKKKSKKKHDDSP
eukprot:Tbor_TRINITY_DN4083_c0_g1::TRINITY_DN4083_c0_g1_i1::g.11701::m.11701